MDAARLRGLAARSSGVISGRRRLRQTGRSSHSKIERRMARVLSAIGAVSEPFLPQLAKTLCLFQPTLVALLLDRRRSPLANSALRVEALLSGQPERDTISVISAQIDRLTASIQPVVKPKRDRATNPAREVPSPLQLAMMQAALELRMQVDQRDLAIRFTAKQTARRPPG